MAIPSVFGGTDVTATVTFKLASGVITDPTDVIMWYRPGPNGVAVESTYGDDGSTIIRVVTGVYSWVISPPVSGPFGLWTVEAEGVGVVNVVWPGQFLVTRPKMADG